MKNLKSNKRLMINMEFKKIFLMLLIGSMLIGSACAAGVNDFKVNDSYKNVYSSDYYAVYANSNQNLA